MPLRKVLLRIMLWSLAFAAVTGVVAVLTQGGTLLWRLIGTGITTAVACRPGSARPPRRSPPAKQRPRSARSERSDLPRHRHAHAVCGRVRRGRREQGGPLHAALGIHPRRVRPVERDGQCDDRGVRRMANRVAYATPTSLTDARNRTVRTADPTRLGRSPEQMDREYDENRETVSRIGVTQKTWFSISR